MPVNSALTTVRLLTPSSAARASHAGEFGPQTDTSILVRWSAIGIATASVVGPLPSLRTKSFTPPRLALQLFIAPGHVGRAFGVAATELADRVVPLGQLWGSAGERVVDQLHGMDPHRTVTLLEAELSARASANEPLVSAAIGMLRGGASVPDSAVEIGVSERHLRRLFAAEVGMSPYRCARIFRLQRLLRDERGDASWTDHALVHGYCDQSHMIREFHELLRATPEQYFVGRRHALGGLSPSILIPSSSRDSGRKT